MSGTGPDHAEAGIGALDVLPVFFRAKGRKIPVFGNSDGVAWKVELLAAAGAQVEVFAENPSALLERAASAANASLHRRRWRQADLDDALVVIADAADEDEARALQAAARKAGVPLNVVDRPEVCDFQFGSIVNRAPLVVAISTAGAAPVFGQAIRARIETLLPAGFANWAAAALRWRPEVVARQWPFRLRRAFWEKFAVRALAEPGRAPEERDLAELIEGTAGGGDAEARGRAILVGAGPGDAELMTLRAVRALQSADIVLYDDLAPAAALDFARREAERIYVGKRGGRPSAKQQTISELLVELVASGKRVVRLKGGDPMIFGRANEEIDALVDAGLSVEIVPGVTAATAAAASLRASLTDGLMAPRVQFVSARAADAGLPDVDWRALADPRATTVAYMGRAALKEFLGELVARGLSPATPVAFVDRASLPDETIVKATVATISAEVDRASLSGPGLLLIGAALGRPSRD